MRRVAARRAAGPVAVAFLVLVTALRAAGQPAPSVPTAELAAPATCELAGRCEAVVRVACPDAARCHLDAPGRLGPFELLQVVESRPDAVQTWRLTLAAFEPGAQKLSALSVRIVNARDGSTTVASTPPATIQVVPPDMAGDSTLRDVAGPIDPGPDWRVLIAWVLGVLAALGALAYAWRWYTRPRVTRAAVETPVTLEGTVAALRALTATATGTRDEARAIYVRISAELRRFLAVRLETPAHALSTTEILDVLARTPRGAAQVPPGRELLERIDEVKFGSARPPHDAQRAAIGQAIQLVERLGPPRPHAAETPRHVA